MSGTPQIATVLMFDCTALEIKKGTEPVAIIKQSESFDVSTTFSGSGFVWGWLKGMNAPWEVQYYAESIGPGRERMLGSASGTLTDTDDTYSDVTKLTIPPNALTPGVYRLACVVKFTSNPGLTGFVEGSVIEVYA